MLNIFATIQPKRMMLEAEISFY